MPREGRRDLTKEKFWRRMMGGQAGSGLSIRGWCRRHALRESGFHWWRRELSRRDAAEQRRRPRGRKSSFVPVWIAGPSAPAEFRPSAPAESKRPAPAVPSAPSELMPSAPAVPWVRSVAAESSPPAGQIEIVLSGDRRIRVIGPVDRRALADVLGLLEAPPC